MTQAPFNAMDPMGIMHVTKRINDLVRAGTPADQIRATVRAEVAAQQRFHHLPTSAMLAVLHHGFARALPLDAREARARAKKAAFQAERQSWKTQRTSTQAADRRSMLLMMQSRTEFGLPVDRSGFPPYHPSGADLVAKGYATLSRVFKSPRHSLSVLRITPAGEEYLAHTQKRAEKRARKFA